MLRHRVATLLTPPPPPSPEDRAEAERAPVPPLAEEGFGPVLLPRFGRRPLGFAGRLLFAAGNRAAAAPTGVWHEIAVYERATEDGFVVAIRQGAGVEGARDLAWAEECDTPAEVLDRLAAHDPVAHLPSEALRTASAAEAERRTWRCLLATLFGGAATAAAAAATEPLEETQP